MYLTNSINTGLARIVRGEGNGAHTCPLLSRCRCSVPPEMRPAVVAFACIGVEFMTYCGVAGIDCVFATFLIEFSGTRFSLSPSMEGAACSCCCCAMDIAVISFLCTQNWSTWSTVTDTLLCYMHP